MSADKLLSTLPTPSKPLPKTTDVLLAILVGDADGEGDNETVVLGDAGELVAGGVDRAVEVVVWVRVIAAGTAVVLAVVLGVVLAGVGVDVVLSAFPFPFPFPLLLLLLLFPFPFPFAFALSPRLELSVEKGSVLKVDVHHWMKLAMDEKNCDQFPALILFLSFALGRSLEPRV